MAARIKADGGSRSEQAYARLRAALEVGELTPGSRVRESEIADHLGISRTPVREAIRRLESEGLITHVAHRGAVIAALDHQATIELYGMREVLEGTAARFAAQHASDAEIAELRELVAAEADLQRDPRRLAQLNRAFHGALCRAAHNRYLLKALLALNDAMVLLGGTTLGVEHRAETAHEEHEATVAAIAGRDPEAAERMMQEHIRNAQRARLKLMRARMLGS